jgi:hypothetical protein
VVPPDSCEISGVPHYLGTIQERERHTPTGVSPSMLHHPRWFDFDALFLLSDPSTAGSRTAPQHPTCNACQLSHMQGLASSAFARHYLRNHNCFLFLWVLRCFTSPRSLQPPYRFRWRSPDITPVTFEVSLFGHPRIKARLPTPRGLSQVTTSFIGS